MANSLASSVTASMGGIFTGVMLAISRAVGETAPLIVVGALAYVHSHHLRLWMNFLCQFKFLIRYHDHYMVLQLMRLRL